LKSALRVSWSGSSVPNKPWAGGACCGAALRRAHGVRHNAT